MKQFPADNYVKVCEKKCVPTKADAASGTFQCTLPAVGTTYSNANFNIEVPKDGLNSGEYFGNVGATNMKYPFDGSIYTIQKNDSNKCTFGM